MRRVNKEIREELTMMINDWLRMKYGSYSMPNKPLNHSITILFGMLTGGIKTDKKIHITVPRKK